MVTLEILRWSFSTLAKMKIDPPIGRRNSELIGSENEIYPQMASNETKPLIRIIH